MTSLPYMEEDQLVEVTEQLADHRNTGAAVAAVVLSQEVVATAPGGPVYLAETAEPAERAASQEGLE